MYKKCTSNSYIYTKNVQPVQNLYKVQTKNGLKLEMYVFCTYKQCTNCTKPIQVANWNGLCMFFVHINNVQTIRNLHNYLTEKIFVCFLYYKQCTNYKKCVQMLIKSYMLLLMYVLLFYVYKTSRLLTLRIFASITIPSSVLFCNFVKCQDQSCHTKKDSQMNLYYRFIYY